MPIHMADQRPCPVCNSVDARTQSVAEGFRIGCPRSGDYAVSDAAFHDLARLVARDQRKSALIGHFLRRMQMTAKWPALSMEVAQRILQAEKLPTAAVQGDNLILWIGANSPGPGEGPCAFPGQQGPIIGASSREGFDFILKGLQAGGLVGHLQYEAGFGERVFLTFNDWDRYENLRSGTPSGRVAFMAMPFGESLLDTLLAQCFRPAVQATGFELRRADDVPKAGLIDDRMRVDIQGCRFLIADLTHRNNGAYWEAGYAEGLGKPVIYTCQRSTFAQASHFDTNHHLAVYWEEGDFE